MAKAKFQGYARGKGFQQSDPGYVGLQRMQDRDDRVIRDLKDNLKALSYEPIQIDGKTYSLVDLYGKTGWNIYER